MIRTKSHSSSERQKTMLLSLQLRWATYWRNWQTLQNMKCLYCIFLPPNGDKDTYKNASGHEHCLTKKQGAVRQLTGAILSPNGTADWTSVEFSVLESCMQLPINTLLKMPQLQTHIPVSFYLLFTCG